jgi:hypothetical protein
VPAHAPLAPRRARSEAAASCLLLAGLVALLAAAAGRRARSPPAASRTLPPPVSVDLARDPAWRLRLLPGIGARRARGIVRLRRDPAALRCLEDLARLPGVGAGSVARLRHTGELTLRLGGRPVAGSQRAGPPGARARTGADRPAGGDP